MTTILGLNFIFHDSSACIMQDGRLLVAMEEERLSRHKHTQAFPELAAAACLEQTGLELNDIDHIAISIQPSRNLETKLQYGSELAVYHDFLDYELDRLTKRQMVFWDWFNAKWSGPNKPEVHFIEHHHTHAAGSFLASPYDEAAILSLDGWGEWACQWIGHGKDLTITEYAEGHFPHSMGCFYSAVTEYCGFKPNYDEGKTMGLAPLGDSTRFYNRVASLIEVDPQGLIKLDLDWFDFHRFNGRFYGSKFEEEFGKARDKKGEFESHHVDLAAAFQHVLEDRCLEIVHKLHKLYPTQHLIMAGGVALNSVMNGRLVRETAYDDLYVMPGAGDNGTSIGAAYYCHDVLLGKGRSEAHLDPYLGVGYSQDEINAVLRAAKLNFTLSDDICADTADLLNQGKIIGWFQGRNEFGPRALGNRSILANPTLPNMKDKINAEVKHREAYRPFAPSVIEEAREDYFKSEVNAPFMLKVCDVREDRKKTIPAIVHVDGSARLQTVHKETNPTYHRLISAFGERSNHPVLLNTSFNIMGEPIVQTPTDAIRCFFSTGLDALAIGDALIVK